jgi:hypothetical protein
MRRSARSSHRPVLRLQTLESRDVPAGNVVATLTANGLLKLDGDDLANAVTIRVVDNSITVTPNADTFVNGFPFPVSGIGVVRAVQANMNGGDDRLRIDPTASFLIPGPLSVNLGPGNNFLGLQTAGRISLGSLGAFTDVGNDTIAVAGGVATGSFIAGTALIGTGSGADAVVFRRITVAGAVSVVTGLGADMLTILDASTFLSTFSAALGPGFDIFRVAQATGTSGPVSFQGTVGVHAGLGNDLLLLGRAATAGGDVNSRVVFNGGTIDGGGGFNDFDPTRARRTGPVSLLNWT